MDGVRLVGRAASPPTRSSGGGGAPLLRKRFVTTLLSRIQVVVHLIGAGFAARSLTRSGEYVQALRVALPRGWPLPLVGCLAALLLCLFAAWKAWRRRDAPPLCWRALVYVVLGAWAVQAFGWRGEHPLRDGWIVTTAAGLHAALCRFAPGVATGRFLWLRIADVVAMNVVMLLVLGEVGLRCVAAASSSPLFIAPGSNVVDRVAAHRLAPGAMHLGFRCNSWGCFDQEFLPRPRRTRPTVLCIGDSFSIGVVPHSRHYTTIAEQELGGIAEQELGDVDLYNMGVSACGPREYLYLWRHEGRRLEPDLLLVALFLGNDISDASFGAEAVGWRDPQCSMFIRTLHRLWVLRHENRLALFRDPATDAGTTLEPSRDAEPAWIDDPHQELPTFSAEEFLRIESVRAAVVGHRGPDPRFDRFTELLAAIVESAGTTPIAFVLIPDEFQVEERLWEKVAARSSAPLERDLPQPWIRAWCAARGVNCLDLLPALRSLPVDRDGWRHAYHLRDTHFNARGNRCAGQALAAFLRPLLAAGKPR